MTRIMFANFSALRNTPFSKEIFKSSSSGKLISSENCYKSLVGLLFGPTDLRILRALIMFSVSS